MLSIPSSGVPMLAADSMRLTRSQCVPPMPCMHATAMRAWLSDAGLFRAPVLANWANKGTVCGASQVPAMCRPSITTDPQTANHIWW